jgi:hypothetical protein
MANYDGGEGGTVLDIGLIVQGECSEYFMNASEELHGCSAGFFLGKATEYAG